MAFLVNAAGSGELTYEQTRRFAAPTRGVRTDQPNPDFLEHLRALALVLPTQSAFSHTTAARLLRLPVGSDPRTHVTLAAGASGRRRKAITWHRCEIDRAIQIAGLPCTDPIRTWQDCGAMLNLGELVAMTDVMLRRNLVNREHLLVPAGRRGARNLRNAVALADPRSLSPRESILRVELHLAGLPAPEVNLDIVVDGMWIACADLAWPLYRVIVEYDGAHHQDPRQRHQDAQTRNALMDLGWQVRVITDKHLQRLSMTVQEIADLLHSRGWRNE